jgi:RNA polymerase sigma-70 factor (ECF subfamily)
MAVQVSQPDDTAVVLRSRAEPRAFATLFSRYAGEIKRYATRRVGPDAAEDVTAETFLVAFRGRDRYDAARGNVRQWLYGIATNLIGRHRHTELKQLRAVHRGQPDPVTESFSERSDARLGADAARQRLAAALAGLPSGHRDALLLVAWADLSYEEAAQALGIPVGTVRSRISRARHKLRQALGGIDPTRATEENDHG